jgi:hypothetical protein
VAETRGQVGNREERKSPPLEAVAGGLLKTMVDPLDNEARFVCYSRRISNFISSFRAFVTFVFKHITI